jgi:E3 ubiquitin-protein ligase HUWE1
VYSDDEEDEEDMDEEDVAFEGDFGEDDRGLPTGTWGWELDEPNVHRGPAFHQHHHRGIPSPWSIMPGGAPPHARVLREFNRTSAGAQALIDSLAIPTYRSHRNQGAPRTDDGTNPLLRRADRTDTGVGSARPNGPDALDWVHAIDPISGGRMLPMDSPVTLMNAIMSAIGRDSGAVLPPGGGIQFSMHGPRGERLQAMPTRLQAILGMRPPGTNLGATHTSRNDPSQAVTFLPVATIIRWQEESRILYGNHYFEKAQFLANPILRILVPPAIEEERQRKEEDEKEHHRRVEAERIAKEEADRLKKEQEEKDAKEQEEKDAKEKEEREARETAEAEAAAAAAAATAVAAAAQGTEANGETTQDGGELVPTESTEPMEGVESTDPDASAADTTPEQPEASSSAEAGPSEQTPRVYTTIRGRQLDITDMQIDQEYLDALPEELREEVIMQQLAEQRSQQAATGEEPSEINAEFLEALPPEIREELLQQEAQDRRRREREANRRRAAENGEPRAEEMDGASFIATLDPGLRQAVLADQPEEVLARLGPEFVNEARALTGRRMPHLHDMPRLNRDRHHAQLDQVVRKPQRLKIVQMLDKAGVATLLRLMFMPQQGSGRQYLHGILHDVCENRQNRGEVVSLLLSILQDGSVDVNAVERSFAQLSLRAKQPASQKTPQPLKRTLSMPTAPTTSTDMSPLMVVQQCLSTLVFLTQYNAHIAIFFLTPHESTSGLKSKTQRKGKGKEDKATKYALNALLTLLDRKLIMDSSSCMEQLSSLLSTITQPLTMLLRKDKEKAEETPKADKTDEANALGITAGPTDEPVPRIAGLPGFEAILGPLITATQAEPTLRVQELTDTDALADAIMSDAEARPVESIETATETPAPPTELVVPSSEQVETTEAAPPANGEGEASAVEKSEEPKKAEEEKPKKRILEPPVIPEHNLRLVVNILAARECNGKTFRETLSSINNLSAIPGAKEVFGKELIAQAQGLSTSILTDLIDLIPHIKEAQTGTEIQGMALAKFSPASSDQAKLLRILTALDYLFDPKRSDSKSKDESFEGKEDLLTTLYESSAFGPLWAKLSECLSAIRQRDNMLNVATILLPLIEALMVVCKNTTLKDAARNIREFSVASPKPESGMEGLFFNFTEDHRKVLNELVRNNPKLMSGTFSLLVKNPKVLEFDNKRNYFSRRLHSRGTERHPQPPLQLSVRREQVFLDSFKSLYFKTPDEMKYGKLSIRFHGEEGVDAGGVTREWFQVLARGMFNPNYALFIPVASDRTTFHPNRLSAVNSEHLLFFKFIGRIIGKALYEGRVLDCHFSRAVYKRILGKTVSIKDMETLDLEYYKSLLWMLENDITDVITENFALETDDFGESRTIDLIENGRNIPVTEENKQEYVQLVVEYRLTGSVKEQLENFLKGFHDIIPAELISIFNEQELELLISGLPDIDVDDWKNNSEYHNYSASSSQIQWFWRAVRSFDKEERAKLLQFVTGTSKVPLNGFRELEGMNGFSKFNIHRDYGNKERLPSSHTCFNRKSSLLFIHDCKC